MRTQLIIFLLVMLSRISYSQITIGYFPFQSILAISTNTERLVWVDYKVETNTFISNLNMEFSPKINLKRTAAVNYYLGAGVSFNPSYGYSDLSILNGCFLDLGVRIKPLSKHRNFQIVFEGSPYVNREFSGGNIRTRLGVAWAFGIQKSRSQ